MNDEEFWGLIAQIDVKALDRGDETAGVKPLQTVLSSRAEEELEDSEEALTQKLYAIDGKAYAENAGEFGFSDDGFLYARLYVVAKGREYYEAVRLDPKKCRSLSNNGASFFCTHTGTHGQPSQERKVRRGRLLLQKVSKVGAIRHCGITNGMDIEFFLRPGV